MMLEEVKVDDAPYILRGFMYIERASVPTWQAIVANWAKIREKFPDDTIVRMIESCSSLDTPESAEHVREFFASHPLKNGDMAVAQMLERLSINVQLRRTVTPRLTAYLKGLNAPISLA